MMKDPNQRRIIQPKPFRLNRGVKSYGNRRNPHAWFYRLRGEPIPPSSSNEGAGEILPSVGSPTFRYKSIR